MTTPARLTPTRSRAGLKPQRRRAVRNPSHRRWPQLDRLEDRLLLSYFRHFQVDGDLQASVNPLPSTVDWDTLNPVTSFALPKIDTVQNDAFNSTTDNQFAGGAKESDPTFTIQTGPSPSKADLTRMYVGHNA